MKITKETITAIVGTEYADLIDDRMVEFANRSNEERIAWNNQWQKNFKPCLNNLAKGKFPPQKNFNKLLELGGMQ